MFHDDGFRFLAVVILDQISAQSGHCCESSSWPKFLHMQPHCRWASGQPQTIGLHAQSEGQTYLPDARVSAACESAMNNGRLRGAVCCSFANNARSSQDPEPRWTLKRRTLFAYTLSGGGTQTNGGWVAEAGGLRGFRLLPLPPMSVCGLRLFGDDISTRPTPRMLRNIFQQAKSVTAGPFRHANT